MSGAQHRKELRTAKSSLSPRQPRRQTSSMKTSTHLARDRSSFPESPRSSSRSLRISRAGLVAWERFRASRVVAHGHIAMNHSLAASIAASQTYSRELEARPMAVRSQRTEGHRLTSCLVSWSRSRIACPEVEATRHDGADDDDFFEPELFHEASPRAGSNLLVRSRRMPGRLLAEALSSMRCFLGSRGEADVSDQPRVLANLETVFNQRYGKDAVGERTSREKRTIAESIDALMEGTSFELAISSYSGTRLWKLPSSTAPGRAPDITSLFQGRRRACLCGRASGHFAAGAPAAEGSRQRGASWAKFGGAPRESTIRGPEKHPARDAGDSENWVFSQRSERSGGRRRRSTASCRVRKVESEARRRKRRRHEGCSSNLDQANDPGRRSWHQLRPGYLKRKEPMVESGCSGVATSSPENRRRRSHCGDFGSARVACCCGAASPLGDLVREVLRTSFTTIEASGNSVRQRDLLPPPVPWSWAPFAKFLWQAVDERRHRSSHRERRRRRELHGVGYWSLLAICVLNFLCAGVGHLQELGAGKTAAGAACRHSADCA